MKLYVITALTATFSIAFAQPQRPLITGLASVGFKVSNIDAARNYYGHVLWYAELPVSQEDGTIYFKVNDRQYIEISPGLEDVDEDRQTHIGFETSNAEALRVYLASKSITVPAAVTKNAAGNLTFRVKDPDGHTIEFIQYLPNSIQMRNTGKFLNEARISNHILHAGIQVADPARANKFYEDVLGFRFMWEGGPEENRHAYISLLVTDGKEWLEYMVRANATPQQLRSMHHVALEVMDIQKAYDLVQARGYNPPNKPVIGRGDGRWLLNLFDPSGSRTELMVRKPVRKPCCTELQDPYQF